MAESTAKPRLVEFAELFQRHGVEFLVIGGQAAALHGSPLPTFDVDYNVIRHSLPAIWKIAFVAMQKRWNVVFDEIQLAVNASSLPGIEHTQAKVTL